MAFLASVVSTRAQTATAAIDGLTVDQTGAVVPGVTVAIVHAATGVDRTVVTARNGRFRAPLLPVGVYALRATLEGFQTVEQEVALTVGQQISLRLEMKVAGVAEGVLVPAVTPLIERGRPSVSSTVDEVAIGNLPVNGRSFIDFVLLTPGVTRDRGGELSFAGQRGTLNSLVVDGADNNHTFFGRTLGAGRAPYQFSQDVVKEFQVNSNAFSAEYGRAGAGLINVVTRSGTNAVRGSAFEYYRDKALNATNVINELRNQPKSAYHYHQFGGTLAGPLRANRDFILVQLRGPAEPSAEAGVPEPAAEHASDAADSGRDRAAAAACRELEPRPQSGCRPDQDRSSGRRRTSGLPSATTTRTSPAKGTRTSDRSMHSSTAALHSSGHGR